MMKITRHIALIIALLALPNFVHAQSENVFNNSLKTTFLSWATGSVKLYYERSITARQSVEAAAGIIGVMYDGKKNNPKGWLARYGHKFNIALTNPDKPLQGLYLKPEAAMSTFRYDRDMPDGTIERDRSTVCAVMGVVGYQLIINRFVADVYWGIGGNFGSHCDTFYEHGFILWDFFGTKNSDIALTSGIKLGVCF